MTHLSLCLFGGFTAELDGVPVSGFNSNKVRALLAYLAVEADRPHRRDTLAAMLWSDSPSRSARTNLRNALANLRKVLRDDDPTQPFIFVTRDTLQFNRSSSARIDLAEFNSQVKVENPTIQQLQNAVDLHQGSFLQGFSLRDSLAFDDWALIVRERLHRKTIYILQKLSLHYEGSGDLDQAVEYSRRQVEMESWNEQAHRNLMRLLAISEHRSAALAQYEICRQVLDAELGVTPSRETKKLYELIKDGKLDALAVPKTAEPAGPPQSRHNLQAQLTPFVGREAEMVAISRYLQDPTCRLLTLVGPGGCGKTRLAIETGLKWVDRFENGVYLVSLASLHSTYEVITALAAALNYTFHEREKPQIQILNYLRNKHMLLLFDNFEHLLPPHIPTDKDQDNSVAFILDILKSAPAVMILATSRLKLSVQGEVLISVTGLAFPEPELGVHDVPSSTRAINVAEYSALALYEVAAQRLSQAFALTDENRDDIIRICSLVSGMPLGIILAAGWSRILSPREIAAQIEKSYDFLETDLRGLPERQRSMRSVLNHSWKLLSTREREIMLALSVFQGPSSRTAIQAVTGAALRDFRSLTDKSMLHLSQDGYFELHELIRQYAAEKLNQNPAAANIVREKHSIYYIEALLQWNGDIKGPRQETAFYEIACELPNIQQAWMWALLHKRLVNLDQAGFALIYFFMNIRLLHIGEQWFRISVEHIDEHFLLHDLDEYVNTNPDDLRACALILGYYVYIDYWTWGRSERTRRNIENGRLILNRLDSANVDVRQDKANFTFSTIDAFEGSKLEMKLQSLEINQALGNKWGTAEALWDLGWTYWVTGQYGEAKRVWQQGLSIARNLGAPRLIIVMLKALGYLAMESGQYELAEQLCEQELRQRQKLLRNAGIENVYESLALISLFKGQLGKARNYANSAVTIGQEFNYAFHIQVGLRRLGLVHMATGYYKQAQKALTESLGIIREIGNRYEATASGVRLAEANLHVGQYKQALNITLESIQLAREFGAERNISFCHLVLGRLAMVNAKYVEAQKQLQKGIEILENLAPRRELGPAYADLCLASLQLGEGIQAKQHLITALEYAVKTGDYVAHVYMLPVAALYFANQGQMENAVELYSLAVSFPMVANSRWFADIVSDTFKDIIPLSTVVIDAAQEGNHICELHNTVKHLVAGLG